MEALPFNLQYGQVLVGCLIGQCWSWTCYQAILFNVNPWQVGKPYLSTSTITGLGCFACQCLSWTGWDTILVNVSSRQVGMFYLFMSTADSSGSHSCQYNGRKSWEARHICQRGQFVIFVNVDNLSKLTAYRLGCLTYQSLACTGWEYLLR